MHRKLKWNAIGLERKSQVLYNTILEEKADLPNSHSKSHGKLQGFLDELANLLQTMARIQQDLIPELEIIFRLKFKTPELVMLALARPSIRNIYEDLEKYFKYKLNNPLKSEEYKELASSGDAANVLALIGDSVLDLGIVQLLWDSSLSTVDKLTKRRADIVANENLARFCDKWDLFNHRLKRQKIPTEESAKEETIIHEKGTLVEAIFGVIYLEFGFDELIRILPLMQ